MTSKTKTIMVGVAASLVLAMGGIGFNLPSLNKVAYSVEPIVLEVETDIKARERARVEHGEDQSDRLLSHPSETVGGDLPSMGPPTVVPPSDYEIQSRRRAIKGMDRGTAMARAGDLNRRLKSPALSTSDRAYIEKELDMVMEEHFTPAAGEPVGSVPPEPVIVPSGFWDKLDPNVVFNAIWGLIQALILGWTVNRARKAA